MFSVPSISTHNPLLLRNISPDNVLYDPKERCIKLVGFGHATTLSSRYMFNHIFQIDHGPGHGNQIIVRLNLLFIIHGNDLASTKLCQL